LCGIAGELSFDALVDPDVLRRMTDALVHRGPDDEGLYCDGRIGLGHRRLSIIDLSPGGHQPMWTADRTLAIVFNGEVYNYREIRPELEVRGYSFVGGSDTEVVINAIHCWGLEAALQRFIGMFAFAVWDTRDRSLLLVRDRVGVKPLYYQKTSKRLLFGSELKALYAHPSFQRDLLHKGLGQFFCFGYTLGDTTVFKDTYKLPAGHYLHISECGDTTLTRYWSLDAVERGSFQGTFEEAAEQLTVLCDSAFAYRLVSDVPVGVFLSGGIDSTFLAAFLKKRLGADLEHITIGFTDPVYDETPKASQVAHDFGLRHTVKTIDAHEAQDALFRFVEIWDEPFGDTSGIPTSILCGLARQQVKAALSADGGDELFCGYDSYPAYDARYQHLQRFPLPLRQGAAAVLRRLPYRSLISAGISRGGTRWNPQTIARYEKMLELLVTNDEVDLTRVMNEKGWTVGSVGMLLNSDPGDIIAGTVFERSPRDNEMGYLVDHMMRTDLAAFLGEDILTKVDRASMAVSLECRDPFLDHRLVEFAFSLPLHYLYQNGAHKRILKHTIQPWITPSVLNSPKRGFSIPLYDWMRGPWKSLVNDYLSPDKIRRVGVLNEYVVKQELDDFYRYRGGRAEKIMLMLNFQMWAERWL
jgi:asparagine synthase (glutamine-hydrolysing)